ncbi:hypothetical protein [Gracilibacillus sp. JCM 18860]|uniref:hypothetical protein n=1 Tax=Gracilibacillus sp. JCM 18860 TaxID=1306159 RepID=UPI0006D0FB90
MDTEGIGVHALKQNLFFNPLLKAYELNENDKTPCWDGGEIFVYRELGKNNTYKKSNLEGKVPIQVKGEEVRNLQGGDTIKYRLHKDDLKNYYKDGGGVIFFVVEFTDPVNTKIYYASLLPFDLKQILKEMGTQKSINHTFTYLPTTGQHLTALCRFFLIHSRMQSQNVMAKDIIFNENDPGRFRFVIPSNIDSQDAFLNYDAYLYQQVDFTIGDTTTSIDIPVQKGKITSLVKEVGVTVGINNKVVYTDVSREIRKDRELIKFGRSFRMEVVEMDGVHLQVKIHFKERGTFKERLKDCQFMLRISKRKEIEVSGHVLELNHNHSSLVKKLPAHIDSLKETIQVFEKLNVSFDVPREELSKDDDRDIELLKQIFLKNNYIGIRVKQTGFIKIRIADKNILLFAFYKNQKEVIIINGCDWKSLTKQVEFLAQNEDGGGGEKAIISPYTCNKVNDLFSMANFHLDDVKSSYLSIDYYSEMSKINTTNHLLEFVTYYDQQTNKNKDILRMVEEVFRHIRSYDNSNEFDFINHMQVVKRLRSFSSEEKKEILQRKNNTDDVFTLCGYFLLMGGNEMEFSFHFDQLTDEEKEIFKTFPIYHLRKTHPKEGMAFSNCIMDF